MQHERTMRIDSIDESGVFQMTLATEGEASDGDILSMKGGQIPERMPLLLSHWNDPTAIAGSVTSPSKELKHSPPRLRAIGQIDMGGVGALADIRRDVAYMTNRHGGAVSIRWDEIDGGDPPVRRVNLSSDHPYFVDAETEKSWKKRNGYFWPSWKALEGSIVALGADGAATIGGRTYARKDGSDELIPQDDGVEREIVEFSDWKIHDLSLVREDGEPLTVTEELKIATFKQLAAIASALRASAGCQASDIINAVTLEDDGNDFTPVTIGDAEVFLPQRLADHLAAERKERAETKAQEPEPDPEPEQDQARADHPSPLSLDAADIQDPLAVEAFGEFVSQSLDAFEERIARKVQSVIDKHTGKV